MQDYTRKLRYFSEYAAFRVAAALFGALPLETASAISGWLWRKIAPRLHRHRRALQNLALAFPEKSSAECEVITLAMWDNLGRTFVEAFHLKEIAASDRITVENPALLEQIATRPGGKLICSGHLANWELMVAAMARHGIKPLSVYQRLKNPLVDDFVRRQRDFLYTGGLLPKDQHTARHLIRSARDGKNLGFLVDLRDFNGEEIEFFGRMAPSTRFPGILVNMLDLPLYVCSIVREDNVRFRFRIEPLTPVRPGERAADILAVNAAIQGEMEKIIRANPAQWMWGHRRWG